VNLSGSYSQPDQLADMMRRTRRIRDYPPLPWVNPDQCLHPGPVTLLKLNEADETLLRCGVCGKIMTTSELGLK
jgi:hypothetical protein